jgi:hypothetical protein
MASVGIFETTEDNTIIYANRRVCEITVESVPGAGSTFRLQFTDSES